MNTLTKPLGALATLAALATAVSTAIAALPDPGLPIDPGRTALVVTDPQNDFLSPDGVAWGVVGKNVEANNTVENKELWAFTDNRIAVRFAYEYHDDSGSWFRAYGTAARRRRAGTGAVDQSAAAGREPKAFWATLKQ